MLTNGANVIDILSSALDFVDKRLHGHGKRSGYIAYCLLRASGSYTPRELCDLTILSLLHDIGAFETEEIDKMHLFETRLYWPHSIYGYLFLEKFSPLGDITQSILYHHAPAIAPSVLSEISQAIYCANAIDLFLSQQRPMQSLVGHLKRHSPDFTDLFFDSGLDNEVLKDSGSWDAEYFKLFDQLTPTEIDAYVRLIIASIDFRSKQTAMHSVSVAEAAVSIAGHCGFSGDNLHRIHTAAMLHDIGKIGTPIHILESTGRLDPDDMARMRDHIVLSHKILDGRIEPLTMNIAINHHEKIDGTGYPRRLDGDELTQLDRIMCVADVLSALLMRRSYKEPLPKEKAIKILGRMSKAMHLCKEVVDITVDKFDDISTKIYLESMRAAADYDEIQNRFGTYALLFDDDFTRSGFVDDGGDANLARVRDAVK